MTSTLQVQTLQGPTSGADSNVIRVADGHTLVGGQGSIIQEQITVFPPIDFTNTSTSYLQTGMEVAITPKLASSKIVVTSIFSIFFAATVIRYGMAARLYNLNTSAQIGLGKNSDGFFFSNGPWETGDGYVQFAVRAVDDQTNSTALRTYGLAIKNETAGNDIVLATAWGTNTITATEIAQ
jgi:hypothetical protein